MRAMVLTGFGGLEQLQLRDVADPEPGPGDVLVQVAAAAVKPSQLYILRLSTGIKSSRGK